MAFHFPFREIVVRPGIFVMSVRAEGAGAEDFTGRDRAEDCRAKAELTREKIVPAATTANATRRIAESTADDCFMVGDLREGLYARAEELR